LKNLRNTKFLLANYEISGKIEEMRKEDVRPLFSITVSESPAGRTFCSEIMLLTELCGLQNKIRIARKVKTGI
jgi:hypothetical protein